jgi:hypothetical protein
MSMFLLYFFKRVINMFFFVKLILGVSNWLKFALTSWLRDIFWAATGGLRATRS